MVCPDGWLLPAWEAQALIDQPNDKHGETWRIARLARQLELWHHDLAAFGCRFLAVLEAHKTTLLQQRGDIEAQLSELQVFEKKIRRQLKQG